MKHIYYSSCLAAILFFSSTLYGQRGKNGSLVVSSTVEVNEYTTLAANAAAGNTSITVANSALNAHNRFNQNLAPGDLIMIIQMQGATILSGVKDSTWGNIIAYNNCGLYELFEVLSVPNSTTIKITCPLINNYTVAGNVQVVRIPRYSTVMVNANGIINCDAWGGQTGGILAMEVLGATTINGAISADSLGFRGGAIQNNSGGTNSISFDSNSVTLGAQKGEGIAGYQAQYNIYGGMFGRGAPADGGGGGDQWNSSGGGGGNGGNIALYNGNGNPDTTNRSWDSAWNLEYVGFAKNVSSGGGRSGYTISWFPIGNPDPNKVPPGSLLWGSIDRNRVNAGGKGGRPLDYSTGRIFEGGGGGAGHEDQSLGGAGGNGGAIIFIQAYGAVSGSGSIHSNGGAGGNDNSNNTLGDGMGGGGSGGTILVNSATSISGITVNAKGGRGGYQYITSSYENEGPGGGGGGGHIVLTHLGIGKSVAGGANGITESPYMTLFPPDGATKGGAGDVDSIASFIIIAKNDTTCPGNSVKLNAILSGNAPLGTTINWYDSATGGTLLASGASYTTPILNKTTIFYVSTCPGTYRQADTVFVTALSAVISSANDSICKGGTAVLIAKGGGSYLWSTNQTTDTIKVAPVTTTTYSLSVSSKGCTGNATYTVSVRPPLTGTTYALPDTVCVLGESILGAVGSNGTVGYKWNTGGTYDTAQVRPLKTTTYSVTIFGKCDTVTNTVTVHVSLPASPIIKGTPNKCDGATDTLTVSGANTYLWNNGTTGNTYITGNIEADSTITVVGYNSIGCPDTAHFNIKLSSVAAIISSATDSLCKGNTALLIAKGGVSYLWSTHQTTDTIKVAPATTTTYTLTAYNGVCSKDTTFTIYVHPPLTGTTYALPDTVCVLGKSILGVNGSNGTTGYKWNTGGTYDTAQVRPLKTTAYTVTIYGKCDTITKTITVNVQVPVPPVIKGAVYKCGGAVDTLTVSGANTYLWNNGTTGNTYITGSIQSDSTITVIGYSSIGCPDTARFNIKILPSPSLTLSDTNTCLNNPVTIHAIVKDSLPVTYVWSPGGQTNSSITVPDTGQTYTVTASNGCITTQSIQLVPGIAYLNACCDKIILLGDDTIMTAHGINLSDIKSYSWSPSVTCLNPICDSVKVTPTVTTTYTVVGTDSLGCQTERVVTIFVETVCFDFTVPNVFTPTNPGALGLNNVFYIKTGYLSTWSIIIYDRWGAEVFKSADLTQYWSGNTESGGVAPAGVYYYVIKGTCENNTYQKDGFVQLIR